MSGNTNDTVFIQKLFTSRENFVDGNVQEATANALAFVGQAGRIWWEPSTNSFYYSDGNTPGGFPIGGGSSGNGTPGGPNNSIQYNAGNGTFAGTSNLTIAGNGIAVVGNVAAAYFLGSGNYLSNIQGSNIIGIVNNANYAAVAGTAGTATSISGANVTGNVANANYAAYAGQVIDNAQPNITSVGTLSTLAVSGNADANIVRANYFYGDGSNLSNINVTSTAAGNSTEIQFNTNGNFNASSNLRFDTSSNTLYTDAVGIPVGTLLSGNAAIVYVITTLTLNQILAFSDGSNAPLPAGSYGNPNEVPAPWAVFEFTTTPSPALEVNDVLSGAGVPVPSSVVYVGTGGSSNVVVTSSTFYGLPTPVPGSGTPIPVARQTLNAGLQITTQPDTDIVMTPGPGGGIIWAGDLIPLTNNEFTLGSPTRRIKQAYFGSNTVYIYDTYLGIDQSISANNGNLIIEGGSGLTVGNFILSGNTIYLNNPIEDFNIGTIGSTGNLTVNRRFNVNNETGQWKLFDINPSGTATLISNVVTGSNIAALEIIGARTRDIQSPNNAGVMLHASGTSESPSRIYNDSYGNVGNGRYSAYIGRRARGNSLVPRGTLNNDIISRIGANPADSSNSFAAISTTRIDFVNSEDQTPSNRGGRIEIWNTPVGSNVIALSTLFDSSGVTLVGNTTTTGIRFADNTFQNTAFNDTSAVTSVTVGVGLTQTATVGDVGIDATGVTTVAGTANQIYVNGNTGGGNSNATITLTLPQNIDSGATLSFANLTITGTLTAANFVSSGNSIVHDKILNLAYDSTSNAQIDGGGIILGNANSSYAVSILYNLSNNHWDTYGAGFHTADLYAANANIDFLNVQNGGHFGVINEQLDYPNAYVQVDSNINSYSQIVSQNHSPGTRASTDLVLVNDIGDDVNHYIDMGINGSNYTDPAFSSTTANDGYLFVNQGNLVIGTDTADKTIKFVAGGTTSNDIAVTISNTGIVTPGNVTANYFIGNGSQLTGIAAGNITGQVANALVAGTVYTNAQPNITSVGTLTSLTVSGNITSGNANLGNLATANYFSGNGYFLTNLNVSNITGTIANANYAAYAGNVVNSLTVNNSGTGAASGATFNGGVAVTISYNTVGAPKADGTGASGTWGISISGSSASANSVAGANVSGQVTYAAVANAVAGANVSGTVANATYALTAGTANSVAGANVTGTVANATYALTAGTANTVAGANVSGQVSNSFVAGTVYTNAQPNITSVGTLTSLTASGNINGANVIGNHYGAGNNLSNIQGANVTGTVANANYAAYAGNVTIAGQSNITSVGTLTGLTSNGVVNFANTSNVTLGSVSNLHISGGSANYVLQTNGAGTLSWAAPATGSGITTITPNALSSTVHIAATVVGNTANIITDATTSNTPNTIVVRDQYGAINVGSWAVNTRLANASYTATVNDYWIGTTVKNITVTLPNAANGAYNGRQYQIGAFDGAGNPQITIATQSPATIVGATGLSQQAKTVTCTYVNQVWYVG
jgi:hypothetical protein